MTGNPNLQLKMESLWVLVNSITSSDAITREKILKMEQLFPALQAGFTMNSRKFSF
jgi:hypothetical protein